jgi:DNA polymerase I-like protein with 3'-5' exonuclease and polymerase domains
MINGDPSIYDSDNWVALDVETQGHYRDKSVDLVCMVGVEGSGKTWSYYGGSMLPTWVVTKIMSYDFIVAHNAKFDMQWLSRMGVELRDVPIYCTMMGEWVILSNRSKGLTDLSLNSSARRYGIRQKLDPVSLLIKAGICPSTINRRWLLSYCQQDVDICRDIFWQQIEQLRTYNLLHVAVNRNNTAACLADIEFHGMTLDPPRVMEEHERATGELAKSYEVLQALAPGVNFNSPKQVVKLLYEDLGFQPVKERGEPVLSSNAKVMAKLKAENKQQEEFLSAYKTYNKADSLISKNLTFFKKVCEELAAKFYGIFNQGATDTGRLSSSGRSILFKDMKKAMAVQLQNIPRQYKKLFWSGDEEWLVGEADAAQLEFRVAADLGRDKLAIQEILDGVDVHSITAQVLTEAGEPTTRQEAKPSTFAPLYGGMGSTKAQKEYADFFKKKYAGISSTQRGWALNVLDTKSLVLPYGMRYYWPDTKLVPKTGYITNSTSIYNYPVQGLATAEIIPLVLCSFWHLTRGTPIRIISTIHDSVVSLFPKGWEQFYEDVSKFCFTDAAFELLRSNYDYEFVAPLGCGIKYSRNWGDSPNEIIYNVKPNGEFTRKEK